MATATGTPSQILDSGKVREDFFHCIAIGLIHVPPLRQRPADLEPFVARVLVRITHEMKGERTLSEAAQAMIGQRTWPGNHPELEATLRRAAVLTDHVIDVEHLEASIFEAGEIRLDLPAEFDIQKKLDDVARHYVSEALTLNDGNKTKASKMLGLNNYQTLTNWMRRLDVGESL